MSLSRSTNASFAPGSTLTSATRVAIPLVLLALVGPACLGSPMTLGTGPEDEAGDSSSTSHGEGHSSAATGTSGSGDVDTGVAADGVTIDPDTSGKTEGTSSGSSSDPDTSDTGGTSLTVGTSNSSDPDTSDTGEGGSTSGGSTMGTVTVADTGDDTGEDTGPPTNPCFGPTTPEACTALRPGDVECRWTDMRSIEPGTCRVLTTVGRCVPSYPSDLECPHDPLHCAVGDTRSYWLLPPADHYELTLDPDVCMSAEHTGFAPCTENSAAAPCACACGTFAQSLQPDFNDDDLAETSGCSDVQIYAYNADSTMALVLEVPPGLVAQAMTTDGPVIATLELPGDANVRGHVGFGSTSALCTDVAAPSQYVMWPALSGTIEIQVSHDGQQAFASATAQDLVLDSPDPALQDATVETFSWDETVVGWYPG